MSRSWANGRLSSFTAALRWSVWTVTMVITWLCSQPLQAYEEIETHFFMTLVLGRESCFNGAEAFLIAKGDTGADLDSRFVASFASPNNTRFHAFGDNA